MAGSQLIHVDLHLNSDWLIICESDQETSKTKSTKVKENLMWTSASMTKLWSHAWILTTVMWLPLSASQMGGGGRTQYLPYDFFQ